VTVEFVDTQRGVYGVESICAEVPIAPSTYGQAQSLPSGVLGGAQL
jgi:hypothetical protein